MVSGASVCPMKMLAATFSDSAPLRAHHLVHHHGEQPDDELHHAEVIENREQRRDEDDRRQDLEGEDHRVACRASPERAGHDARPTRAVAQRAEDERRADRSRNRAAGGSSRPAPRTPHWPMRGLQDDQREQDLQAQAPADDPQADGAAVGRQRVGEAENADQPDQRLQRRQDIHIASHPGNEQPFRRCRAPSPCTSGRFGGAWSPITAACAARAHGRVQPRAVVVAQLHQRLAGRHGVAGFLEQHDAGGRSTGSPFLSRPAPSATAARPTSNASSAVT